MSDATGKGAGKWLTQETWDAMKAAGYTEEELQKDQPFGPTCRRA